MPTVSTHLPDDLAATLRAYADATELDRDDAVRKLLSDGLENWRRERALRRLEAGEISFNRAAELAGMNVWEFAALVEEREAVWVSSKGVQKDLANI